ncbi:hypothetical protein EKO25_01975 [Bacillus sp. SAJ1]|nr:hypothetical protein EKO25_01975 [Bacillus sp. SAJ1]
MTEPLVKKSELGVASGGNGNPGLFPWFILFPFFLIFLYGTFKYLTNFILKKNMKFILIVIFSSSLLSLIIVLFTNIEANKIREKIVEVSPSFTSVKQLSLLNTWSNSIFFNHYTFILVFLLVLLASSIYAAIKISTSLKET